MELGLSVKNQSIETSGITKDYQEAICEYIWNGFEANADKVILETTNHAAGGVFELLIQDNGDGIDYDTLSDTFGSFMASQKTGLSLQLKTKANGGKGRFSFCAFASDAHWKTIYSNGKENFEYTIDLSNINKSKCEIGDPCTTSEKTGTTVSFAGIDSLYAEALSLEKLESVLQKAFAWYLYLNKEKALIVNGAKFDCTKYIDTNMSASTTITIEKQIFKIDLVVWLDKIKETYWVYYLDESNTPRGRDTTSYNRNTLSFSHSVFIKSAYFNNKSHIPLNSVDIEDDAQTSIEEVSGDNKILKTLKKKVSELISSKIRDFAIFRAEKAIVDMRDRNSFPQFSDDQYGQLRRKDLETVTREIYCLEPKIFIKLNGQQEKSFLGFLNLLLNSEERENILTILSSVVELTTEQRKQFAEVLKRTELENIINTIKFIEDRYTVIEGLKKIVFEITNFANERDHVQKIVEQHYWLFGEQYHLVSADKRMQKALDEYRHILYGNSASNKTLDSDKEAQRRMDIFLCGSRRTENGFETPIQENLIIELKSPKIILSKQVHRQIEDYMDFIRRRPEFNSQSRKWKFISICTSVDDDIKSRYIAEQSKGKKGLVTSIENYEIYALTWDDVFSSFDLSHGFLLDQLKIDRDALAEKLSHVVGNDISRQSADNITTTLAAIG